jgi:hypothetical protein
MYSPTRGPERLIRVGQWAITLLFAYFLIQVGASLIADLPLLRQAPRPEQFQDPPAQERLAASLRPLERERAQLQERSEDLERRRRQATETYEREKRGFENWRSARAVTEQTTENPEVLARVRQLDAQLEAQRQLAEEQEDLRRRLAALDGRMTPLLDQRRELEQRASARYRTARRRHAWGAFLIRLLFALPLLLVSIVLFRRYRDSDQWPFVWGFLLFGLFVFFVELVPYLPSFGAYIRYGMGAVLTFLGGRALIRRLRRYLRRKQEEQAAPQEERLLQIRYEKALVALSRNQCPGCERRVPRREGQLPDYCMHCGLRLQVDCATCGDHHPACFPFCPACGASGTGAGSAPA